MPLSHYIKRLCIITLLTIALLLPAIYNLFPIVTPDTTAYIKHAFDIQLPSDRSPFYGIFVGVSSMWKWLWGPVIIQSLLLAFLLYKFTDKIMQPQKKQSLLGAALVVSLLTGAAAISSYIMPDVFTSIMLLSAILYCIDDTKHKLLRILYLFIFFTAIIIHNSHFLISLLLCTVVLLGCWMFNKYRCYARHMAQLLLVSVAAVLFMCSIHYAKGFGFTLSRGSHVFMMGKLAESGVLKQYLTDNCPAKAYKLCAYINEMPSTGWEFLWNYSGPLYKTGGWDSSSHEYKAIIKDVFTTPRYMGAYFLHAGDATMHQLTYIQIKGEVPAEVKGSTAYDYVEKYYPAQLSSYLNSRQNNYKMNMDVPGILYTVIFWLASILLLIFIKSIWKDKELQFVCLFVIAIIVCNAFVTATFANVLPRLQYRISWVWPAYCLLAVGKIIFKKLVIKQASAVGY